MSFYHGSCSDQMMTSSSNGGGGDWIDGDGGTMHGPTETKKKKKRHNLTSIIDSISLCTELIYGLCNNNTENVNCISALFFPLTINP